MTLIAFLKEFPAIFAVIGLLVGGAVMFWVTKKFGPMRSDALNEVVGAYKLQITANKELLEMQKAHYEIELDDMKKERDSYRTNLHAEKQAHQAVLLTVADLQSRPNVDKVYEGQQAFFAENTKAMHAILQMIRDHDYSIEARTIKIIQPVQDMCAEVVRALNGHKLKLVKQTKTPSKVAA